MSILEQQILVQFLIILEITLSLKSYCTVDVCTKYFFGGPARVSILMTSHYFSNFKILF